MVNKRRFRTSDIGEALNLSKGAISKLASRNGIKGEGGGLGRGKQNRFTLAQAEAIARAWRGEDGVKQLHRWMHMRALSTQEEEGQVEKVKETHVHKALSESYARTVRRMTEETDWWIDAVTKIGHSTVLAHACNPSISSENDSSNS